MAGFEQTIIVGNVGRDPEMRYLQSGTAVTNFSVAVSRSWTDKQTGERREFTNWYRCNIWGERAESANKYIKKGSALMIRGTVEAKAYMGSDGEAKASLELRVDDWQFVGSRGDANTDTNYDNEPQDLEDIPF